MKAILSADANWGIGKGNKLLVRISEDMKYFRMMTTGKVIIMGRKTLESFPEGKPLKNRVNVVLSRQGDFANSELVEVYHSLPELLDGLAQYDEEDLFVVGGEQVYRLLLPYCDTVYVTRIDHAYDADKFFPDLNQSPEWVLSEAGEIMEAEGVTYRHCEYNRIKKEAE